MKIEFLSSFDRAFKKLSTKLQQDTSQNIERLIKTLQDTSHRPQGLGLRQLHRHFWEIRVGLKIRVLFELGQDSICFIIVGNHDDIKRFLKRI